MRQNSLFISSVTKPLGGADRTAEDALIAGFGVAGLLYLFH